MRRLVRCTLKSQCFSTATRGLAPNSPRGSAFILTGVLPALDRCARDAPADQLEEQVRRVGLQRQVAEFVDDQQLWLR
jgi:hypothetical protein